MSTPKTYIMHVFLSVYLSNSLIKEPFLGSKIPDPSIQSPENRRKSLDSGTYDFILDFEKRKKRFKRSSL